MSILSYIRLNFNAYFLPMLPKELKGSRFTRVVPALACAPSDNNIAVVSVIDPRGSCY